jgi:hypothetical protein
MAYAERRRQRVIAEELSKINSTRALDLLELLRSGNTTQAIDRLEQEIDSFICLSWDRNPSPTNSGASTAASMLASRLQPYKAYREAHPEGSSGPQAERAKEILHLTRDPSGPIRWTPRDALLVKEGVLPPIDQQAAADGTNAEPRVSLRMRNLTLAVAAESYSEFVGKKVTVQEGLTIPITVHAG